MSKYAITLSEATVILSEATVILSEATVILSEATVILSEATVILSEATVILSEAKDRHAWTAILRSLRSSRMTLAALTFAVPLLAQTPATIDPDMTRAQVVARLGEPLSAREFQSFTYLLYKNGCEKTCGMNDLVVLDSGKVVDAVFRSAARRYTGTSSSPRMLSRADAKRDGIRDAKTEPKTGSPVLPKKPTT